MPHLKHPRLALKVDCDTFEGTLKGLPKLLSVFEKNHIQATFLFTLGPDNSGRAIKRVFTQKGFVRKMFRSKALSLYGPKTMLYGTLLPAPMIGKKLGALIKSVAAAGHEVGVHGWDHVRWHDRLEKMSEHDINQDYGRAHQAFEGIFGFKARVSGAPGWHATAGSLRVQDRYNLLYTSDTRGGSPCFLEADGQIFRTLEIPSTLPTWDETLGTPELKDKTTFLEFYKALITGTEVHSMHTEVEGSACFELFQRQVALWKADGVQFIPLEKIANEALEKKNTIPIRRLVRTSIPHRGGLISSSVEKTHAHA